jgi:hypothetical protein
VIDLNAMFKSAPTPREMAREHFAALARERAERTPLQAALASLELAGVLPFKPLKWTPNEELAEMYRKIAAERAS